MITDTIIGIVGGAIVGLIITHVYYRLQKRRRELCWSEDNTNLIKGYSSLFEKLEIQYEGQQIENLTVSKIAFWNNGNETIDHEDIAIPPYIWPRIEDTKILDVQVVAASTVGNRFEAINMPDHFIIALKFDYLDPQQGAVIQVIHTSVAIAPLMVGGEVKGVKDIQFKSKRPDFWSQVPRFFIYFYAIWVVVLLGIAVYNSVFQGVQPIADWPMGFLFFMWLLVLVFVYFDFKQIRDTAKIPKELSVFEKDDIGIKKRE